MVGRHHIARTTIVRYFIFGTKRCLCDYVQSIS